MPNYEYECETCKKVITKYKPIAECATDEHCEKCNSKMARLYGFQRRPEFWEYFDEQYQKPITSARQEEKEMRKHGHIYAADTGMRERFRDDIKRKQRKPIYSYGR